MSTQHPSRKTISGPVNAQPLLFGELPAQYAAKRAAKLTKSKKQDIESQISRTFLQTGLISNANGSGYLELDDNIISVSVYGPRPIRGVFSEKSVLNVNLNDNTGLLTSKLKNKICSYIENNFIPVINSKKYPKSSIDIFINIISVENVELLYLKLLSLISNVTTLSLINAKIEIIDLVVSAFDLSSNTITSFIKNDEIVGIWSDSGELVDLNNTIEALQKDSLVLKSSLVSFLMSEHQS